MDVLVHGKDMIFPAQCCCCGGAADDKYRVKANRKQNLLIVKVYHFAHIEVPCCILCAKHMTWNSYGGYLNIFVRGLILITAWILIAYVVSAWNLPQSTRFLVLGIGSLLMVLGILIWLKLRLRYRPGKLGPEHSTRKQAVRIIDFEKESVTLRFSNDAFARNFAQLNRA